MYKNYFKSKHSFEKRKQQSHKLLEKYPDKIPIIFEKIEYNFNAILPYNLLVPKHITIAEINSVIRKKLKITKEQAIFLFVEQDIICPNCVAEEIYYHYKDNDGFLYIQYTFENTFGK